ncbi:nucleoprotein [Punique virus]|uniref:Nonstructural protein n=1 Tax=Punique virus TaxID=693015 RepID=D6BP28_9VIRU|nr:nucleoprotein [Punique virus]ACZ43796.1 nonstructural protein [Punique virus]AFH88997.1 nucleoprotein [Punique virus]
MISRIFFLKQKSNRKRTNRRFYVDADVDFRGLSYPFSLYGSDMPFTVSQNKVKYDSRPTLNHYLSKGEFPAMLSRIMITATSTTLYNQIMLELFSESTHQIKRYNKDFLISALRWPTGLASLEFIEFYYADHVFLSDAYTYVTNKMLKLFIKASGLMSADIEAQIKIIYRKVLLEGSKYGLTCYDLTGADLIEDICIVQCARVARLAFRKGKTDRLDTCKLIYQSLSPYYVKCKPKQEKSEVNTLQTMSCFDSFEYFMAIDLEFRSCALSTSWTRDWPTAKEAYELVREESKRRSKKHALMLPVSPDYPPLN